MTIIPLKCTQRQQMGITPVTLFVWGAPWRVFGLWSDLHANRF